MKSNEVLRSEFQSTLAETITAHNQLIDFSDEHHAHYMSHAQHYPIGMLDAEELMAARVQNVLREQGAFLRRRLQELVSNARPLYLPLQIKLPETKDLKFVSTNVLTY